MWDTDTIRISVNGTKHSLNTTIHGQSDFPGYINCNKYCNKPRNSNTIETLWVDVAVSRVLVCAVVFRVTEVALQIVDVCIAS